jgi:hypothetical protein
MMSSIEAEEKKVCSRCKFYVDELYNSPEGRVCSVCVLGLAKKYLEARIKQG